MAILSKTDLTTIEAAIARAESRSAGELVVALVRRSGTYDAPRALFAFAWTVAAALGVLRLDADLPVFWLFLGQVPVALGCWWLLGLPLFQRRIAGRGAVERAVRARALQMFAERGVHQTRDRSGLLILISELERKVVILGDSGIHTHIGSAGWEQHVSHLVGGIKNGTLGVALVEVIDRFGEVLGQHFPRRPDDVNELPDAVVRE